MRLIPNYLRQRIQIYIILTHMMQIVIINVER